MALQRQRSVFGFKLQTVHHTAVTLLAADADYNALNAKVESDFKFEERAAQGQWGSRRSVPTELKGKASVTLDLSWDGATLPSWTKLLPACGLVKDANADIFRIKTETPDTNGAAVKTATIGQWLDGLYTWIHSAMGKIKFVIPTAGIPQMEFEFEGLWGDEVDAAMIEPTYPTEPSLKAAGGPVTFDGRAFCPASSTFDLGGTLYARPCPNKATGFENVMVQNMMPKFSADPESKLVAADPRLTMFKTGDEGALIYTIPGPLYDAQANTGCIILRATHAQYRGIQRGERGGLSVDQAEWNLNANPAQVDRSFSLEFVE